MSKCPINTNDSAAQQASWSSWFSSPKYNSANSNTSAGVEISSCPVSSREGSVLPASLEEASRHAQTPQPDQRFALNKERLVSSIPRGEIIEAQTKPHHQHDDQSPNWVYPSEQQLYNAMRRKGWQNIPEDSIPMVLKIHNGINEGTWGKIIDWEGNPDVRLVRFQGRPKDLTPKAFIMSKVLGLYTPPFDRHDWYVEDPINRKGELQRYVIDYYMIEPKDPTVPPKPYVDARPALEGPRGVRMRAQRFVQDAFPGFAAYWRRYTEMDKNNDT